MNEEKDKSRASYRDIIIKAVVAVALLAATLCVTLIGNANPSWVSQAYKPFSRFAMRVFGTVWSVIPTSVAEVLVYCGIVFTVARLVAFVIRLVKSPDRRVTVMKFACNVALTATAMFAVFQIGWGINYSAMPLADELGLTVHKQPPSALGVLAQVFADELNTLAHEVPRDDDGSVVRAPLSEVAGGVRQGYATLNDELFGGAVPVSAKPVIASRAMSFTKIVGIFMPFTGEANINVDVHPSTIPFTVAHEMAHSIGVAPENEANFAAFLACRASDDAATRYSGYLAAFTYVYNAYVSEDIADAVRIYNALDDRVRKDYSERASYWDKLAETPVQQVVHKAATSVATAVNDTYIQAMGVPDGVKSYGMVVDLLLAEHFAAEPD